MDARKIEHQNSPVVHNYNGDFHPTVIKLIERTSRLEGTVENGFSNIGDKFDNLNKDLRRIFQEMAEHVERSTASQVAIAKLEKDRDCMRGDINDIKDDFEDYKKQSWTIIIRLVIAVVSIGGAGGYGLHYFFG